MISAHPHVFLDADWSTEHAAVLLHTVKESQPQENMLE